MVTPPADLARDRLRITLRESMIRRDRSAAAALRGAIAALDNAEAVPVDGHGPAVPAAGSAEVARRELSQAEVDALLQTEVTERDAAAASYDDLGHPDRAAALRREAQTLTAAMARG